MMEVIVVVLASIASALYAARPLLRGPRLQLDARSSRSEAEQRRDGALAGLDDLEFDRAAGKLSDTDFEHLRMTYEAEAAAALHDLDELARTPVDAPDPIEAEIAAVRRALRCSNCGAPRGRDERCARCGA